jgi:hypothetical protein
MKQEMMNEIFEACVCTYCIIEMRMSCKRDEKEEMMEKGNGNRKMLSDYYICGSRTLN